MKKECTLLQLGYECHFDHAIYGTAFSTFWSSLDRNILLSITYMFLLLQRLSNKPNDKKNIFRFLPSTLSIFDIGLKLTSMSCGSLTMLAPGLGMISGRRAFIHDSQTFLNLSNWTKAYKLFISFLIAYIFALENWIWDLNLNSSDLE